MIVTGNTTATNTGAVCIHANSSTIKGDVTITDSKILNNTGYGLDLYLQNDIGEEVTVSSTEITGNAGYGIYMRQSNNHYNVRSDYVLNIEDGTKIYKNGNTGLYANGYGTLNIKGGEIYENTGSAYGGGVHAEYIDFNMSGGEIHDNTATKGGGIYLYESTYTYEGGTFSNVKYGAAATDTITGGEIYNNTSTNTTDSGGGIYVANYDKLAMTGGTVTSNTAGGQGGGVYMHSNSTSFILGSNDTEGTVGQVYGNTALIGQDVYSYYEGGYANTTLGLVKAEDMFETSSGMTGIGWLNESTNVVTTTSIDYDPVKKTYPLTLEYKTNTVVAVIWNATKNIDGGYDEFYSVQDAVDALLSDKTNGTGAYYTTDITSPEIILVADSVGNVEISGGQTLTLNLNGYTLKGTTTAITCYGTLTIKDVQYTTGDDSSSSTYCEHYDALVTANQTAHDGDTNLGAGKGDSYTGTITGTSATLGGGIHVCTGGYVTMISGEIANCSAGGTTANNVSYGGAGVYIESGTFVLSGTAAIKNCSTKSYGGAVFLNSTSGTFILEEDAVISGNSAYHGGGVYVRSGTFKMTGGSITGNTAAGSTSNTYSGFGGGVYVYAGTAKLSDGEISNNTATGMGGGMYINSGTVTLSGDIKITENTVTGTYDGNAIYGGGGGIYMNNGTLTIRSNAEITGNTAIRGGAIYQYNGTINMLGGQITGNTAEYGGGLVQYPTQSGKFTMSGGVLCDNISSLSSAGNDVYSVTENGYSYTGSSYPVATLIRAADMDYTDEGYSAPYNVWKDDSYSGDTRTSEYVGQGQYVTEAISSSKDLMLTADEYGTATATVIETSNLEVSSLTLDSKNGGIVDGSSYWDSEDDTNLKYKSVIYKDETTGDETTVDSWSATSLQNAVAGTWKAGYDDNSKNGLVRTFDTVSYNCSAVASFNNGTGDENKTVRLYVKVVVPLSSDEVDISVTGITEEETSESEDGTSQTFIGYYDIPESGYTATFTINLKVKAMKNGDLIEPEFSSWIEENATNKATPATMEPTAVTVSATGMYNTTLLPNNQLAYTGYFDLTTGEETTADAYSNCLDGSIIYGTMLGFGITLSVWNEIEDKGMKGIEVPEGEITFNLELTGEMLNTNEVDSEGKYKVEYTAAPYVWAYKANEDTDTGNSLNDEIRSVNMNWNDEDDLTSTSQYAYDGAPFNVGGNAKSCYSGGAWTATGSQPTDNSTSTIVNFSVSGYVFDSTFSTNNPYQTSDGSNSKVFYNSFSRAFSAGYIQVIYPIDTNKVTTTNYGYMQVYMEGILNKFTPTITASGIVSEDLSDLTKTDVEKDLEKFTSWYGSDNEATYATNEITYLDNYASNQTGLYLAAGSGESLTKTNYFNNENNGTLTSSGGSASTPLSSVVYMGSDLTFTSDVIDATKIDGYNSQTDNATEYNYMTSFDILEKFDADAYTPVGTTDPIVNVTYTQTATTNSITDNGNTIFRIVTTESATDWSTNKTTSYTLTILYAAKTSGKNWDNTRTDYGANGVPYASAAPEMDEYGEEDLIYFTTLDNLYAYFEAKGETGVCVGILYEFRDCCIRTGRKVSVTARMNVTDDFDKTGQTWCKTNDVLAWSAYRPTYKTAYAAGESSRLALSYQYSWTNQEYATSGNVTAYGAGGDSAKMAGSTAAAETYTKNTGYTCATGSSYSGYSKLTKYEPGYVKTEYSGGWTVTGTHTGWYEGNCLLLYTMESSIDIEVADRDQGSTSPKTQYKITSGECTVNYTVKADLSSSSGVSNVLVTNGTQLATVVITITLDDYLFYDEGSLKFTYGTTDDDYQEGELSFSVLYDEDTHVITVTTVVSDISKNLPTISYSASIGDGSDEKLTNGQELTATAEIYIEYEEEGLISTTSKKDSVKITLIKNGSSNIYKKAQGTRELGEDIVYSLYYNNSDTGSAQIELGDILPYNGDGRNTSFSGGYRVTTITVKFTDKDSRDTFINGKSTGTISGSENYIKYGSGFDCTKTSNLPTALYSLYLNETKLSYSSITVDSMTDAGSGTTYYYVTYELDSTAQNALTQYASDTTGLGLYFYFSSVAAQSSVQIDLTLSPLTSDSSGTLITSDGETQTGGDIYYNNLFYRNVTITSYDTSMDGDGYSYEDTALGSTASVSILSRTISGRVWMDMDRDGVYNTATGYEEDVLANVDVYLYYYLTDAPSVTGTQVTGTNVTYDSSTGEYCYTDSSGNTTKLTTITLSINGSDVTLYPVIDALGNLVVPETTSDNGKYEFDKLLEGTYYVVFKDGDGGYYIGGSSGSAPIDFSKLSVTKLSTLNGETNKAVADYGDNTDSNTTGAAALTQANIINEGDDGNGTATSGIDLTTTASVTNVYYQNLGLYYYKLNLIKEWEELLSQVGEGTAVTFNVSGTDDDSNNTGTVTVVDNDYTMTQETSDVTGSCTENIPASQPIASTDFNVTVDDSNLATDRTVTWTLETELALQAEGSNGTITYTFTESAVEPDGNGTKTLTGFVSSIETVDDSGSSSTISVTATNTQILYDLNLYKISDSSTDSNTVYLAGAEFTLYSDESCDADDVVTLITGSASDTSGLTSGFSDGDARISETACGLLSIGSLAQGTYYLKETTAPTGYALNQSVWEIVISYNESAPTIPVVTITQIVDKDGNAITSTSSFTETTTTKTGTTGTYYIQNADENISTNFDGTATSYAISFEMMNYINYTLPESGGIGTMWMMALGLALVLAAASMLLVRSRRRRG